MHYSVMLKECLDLLNLKDNSIVVDCTLGYAGHSSEILKKISKGHLYAFDQDQEAINYSKKTLKKINKNFTIIKSNFVNIKSKLNDLNVQKVNGILFDLGVSSPQLDNAERGFSFHQDATLDMRMDQESKLSAYEVVNEYSFEQLMEIFYKYGEEKYAKSIARGIEKARKEKPIKSTLELVEIIKNNVPSKYRNDKHPARKVFQAIRIEVNNELNVFEKSLKDALDLLDINGRIVVITFHSLEDKICKDVFKKVTEINKVFKNLPIIPDEYKPKFKVIEKLKPNKEELNENNRSRSAKVRVIERVEI